MPGMYMRRLAESGVATDRRTSEEMEKSIREGLPHPHAPTLFRIDAHTIGIRRNDGGEDNADDVFRWEDPGDDPYAVVFGKLEGNNKIHMAYSRSGRIMCRSRGKIETVICGPCGMYPGPVEADGRAGTFAALLRADVSPTLLCRNCFFPQTVGLYTAAYKEHAEGTSSTPDVCGTCGEPVTDHTIFGRQLADPDPTKVWHTRVAAERPSENV